MIQNLWYMDPSGSKSKKNVIDPENIINNQVDQSDYLFFQIPPEKDVQWSEQGILSSHKFIQKLWALHLKIKKKLSDKNIEIKDDLELNNLPIN